MTDVFLRHFPSHPLRKHIWQVCLYRWSLDVCSRLVILLPHGEEDFHIRSKHRAEEQAESEIYIVADDDCLILGKDFVERGMDILSRHPEYGLVSATSISDGSFPAGAPSSEEIVELHSVGGVVFVRRGILKDFTACTPEQVDTVICAEINRQGLKTGVLPQVKFNHLGAGYSLSSKGIWSA